MRRPAALLLALGAAAACGGEQPTQPADGPVKIVIAAIADSLYERDSVALSASLLRVSGAVDTAGVIAWSTSNAAVATVSPAGQVRALATGIAWIRGTHASLADSVRVRVIAPVAQVVFGASNVSGVAEFVVNLPVVLLSATGDTLRGRLLTWRSSDPSIVQVGPLGGALARRRGTAAVIVTCEGHADTATVNVRLRAYAAIITAIPDTLHVGDVRQLSAVVLDSLGDTLSGVGARWLSRTPRIADVDSGGTVRVRGAGDAAASILADGNEIGRTGFYAGDLVLVEVAVSNGVACGRTAAGQVFCWTRFTDPFGQLGNPALPASNDTVWQPTLAALSEPIARLGDATGAHLCAVSTSATAWCWGNDQYGQADGVWHGNCNSFGSVAPCSTAPVHAPGGLTFRAVAAGNTHSCGLAADSTAWCWGGGYGGALGNGAVDTVVRGLTATLGGHKFVTLDAAGSGNCAVGTDSLAWCWGGSYPPTPTSVAGPHFTALSLGRIHVCGLTAAGAAYCWLNNPGLGIGTSGGFYASPVPVSGGLVFASIAAGDGSTCGVTTGHDLYCWGSRVGGNRLTPVFLASGYTGVVGTHGMYCAFNVAGRVLCWDPVASDTPILVPGQR